MILKEADDRASDIAELQSLLQIHDEKHHTAIQKQIDNIRSGVSGERSAAHFIDREFSASKRVMVLHDLRIDYKGDFSQIDHLLIHRIQGTAWVLETKNYTERLTCDEHGDWTIWNHGKPRPIPSPISQAKRHCETVRLWLEANGFKGIHTIHPVVLISPTSSVNRAKLKSTDFVVKSDNFGRWWEEQADKLSSVSLLGMLGRHLVNGMSQELMIFLADRLIKAHTPAKFDWASILRLPDIDTSQAEGGKVHQALHMTAPAQIDSIKTVQTPHGDVTISLLPDGRYALRNEKNDALIEHVRKALSGKGKWNPRFKNWLIGEEDLHQVITALK